MAQELDQAQRRRHVVLQDDLTPSRKWESTVDIISQGPCAPINPRGWSDPLTTPQDVLMHAIRTDPDTGRLYLALREGYALWRDQLKQKHIEYDQRLYNDAMMLFGQEGPTAYETRAVALIMYTGPAPQAWEPVEAALQGNSAALGLKPLASDPRIAKYFAKHESTIPDFRDDSLGDLEEQHDPDAVGGKTQKVPRRKAALAET